jgi:hypothetical protein
MGDWAKICSLGLQHGSAAALGRTLKEVDRGMPLKLPAPLPGRAPKLPVRRMARGCAGGAPTLLRSRLGRPGNPGAAGVAISGTGGASGCALAASSSAQPMQQLSPNTVAETVPLGTTPG